MYKVESFDMYKELKAAQKGRAGKLINNIYFMPNEIKRLIELNKLYYESREDGLYFYVDETDYLRLYYIKSCEKELQQFADDKTLVLDFVFKENQQEFIKSQTDEWLKNGFKKYKRYVRMKKSLSEIVTSKTNEKYKVEIAGHSQAEAIIELWRESLDILSTSLPSVSEMYEMIDDGNVYCIDDNGNLVAAVFMNITGKTSVTLSHLSVSSKYRKQGIASVLVDGALNRMVNQGIENCILWVDEKNTPAYNMYVKYKFIPDGLISDQYLNKI